MTKQENQFENAVVQGIITSTSNKMDDNFKQEKPSKTLYIVVEDKNQIKELESLGLMLYKSEDKTVKPFFIIKAVTDMKVYKSEKDYEIVNFGIYQLDPETGEEKKNPNYQTEEPVFLSIIKVKGQKGKNGFYRVNAILDPKGHLQEVKSENPFESLFKDGLPF